ncbi:MAG: hypothetical protein LBQ13_04490, partial [Endomicrobium sp.]|nr:hypothetical protein [Endomicrobium sp.]
ISRNGFKGNKNISVLSPLNGKSLTSQLKFAEKVQAEKTILFAKTEFKIGKVLIKNMKDKSQIEVLMKDL